MINSPKVVVMNSFTPSYKQLNLKYPTKNKIYNSAMNMFDYSDCKTHQVQDGESLFDIAEANHIALQQLRYFNHINKATLRIRPNQTIYIPNKPVPVPAGE